jgi:hypothetical protein
LLLQKVNTSSFVSYRLMVHEAQLACGRNRITISMLDHSWVTMTSECDIFGPQQQHHVVTVDIATAYKIFYFAEESETSSLIPPSMARGFHLSNAYQTLKEISECQPRYWPKLERMA